MKSLTHSVAAMTLLVAANSAAGPGSSNVNISLTGEVIATASCSFSIAEIDQVHHDLRVSLRLHRPPH
uniref:type 1 fimbrial protein n=1 Tax=Stenotrophomonas pavanii TaxID=487698 RepID=UPI0015F420FD